MVDPIDVNRRNWDERATIHARDTTGDYMLRCYLAGLAPFGCVCRIRLTNNGIAHPKRSLAAAISMAAI